MSHIRVEKIQKFIKQEISKLLISGIKDPRIIGFVTITKVEVSNDLRFAKVYFSTLNSKYKDMEIVKSLEKIKGYIRSHIGKYLGIRFTPELAFKIDESSKWGAQIQKILEDINGSRL